MKQQNRPYNVQLVSDNLAQFGIKKGQVQRAMEALADSQLLICKEFGKVKIYMPPQDSNDEVPKEELDRKQQQVREVSQQVASTGDKVKELQKELRALENTLTVEQIEEQTAALQAQAAEQSTKLAGLKQGGRLVSAADRAAAEKALQANLRHWSKRRGIFRALWDSIRENIDANHKEMLEDMGIETDESVGEELSSYQRLFPKRARLV